MFVRECEVCEGVGRENATRVLCPILEAVDAAVGVHAAASCHFHPQGVLREMGLLRAGPEGIPNRRGLRAPDPVLPRQPDEGALHADLHDCHAHRRRLDQGRRSAQEAQRGDRQGKSREWLLLLFPDADSEVPRQDLGVYPPQARLMI